MSDLNNCLYVCVFTIVAVIMLTKLTNHRKNKVVDSTRTRRAIQLMLVQVTRNYHISTKSKHPIIALMHISNALNTLNLLINVYGVHEITKLNSNKDTMELKYLLTAQEQNILKYIQTVHKDFDMTAAVVINRSNIVT